MRWRVTYEELIEREHESVWRLQRFTYDQEANARTLIHTLSGRDDIRNVALAKSEDPVWEDVPL